MVVHTFDSGIIPFWKKNNKTVKRKTKTPVLIQTPPTLFSAPFFHLTLSESRRNFFFFLKGNSGFFQDTGRGWWGGVGGSLTMSGVIVKVP